MDQSDNRAEAEIAWNEFVGYLEGSWAAFYHDGKMVSPKFQPWAGKFEKQRKTDELLKYLVQSRHVAQHAQIKLDWGNGKMHLRPGIDVTARFRNFKIFSNGGDEIEFESGIPGNRPQVIIEPGKAMLPEIYNAKYKQRFPPPNVHLRKYIGSKYPIVAANLAIKYYQTVYEEGVEQFRN